MIKPDKPANEALRLEALYRYRILDSEREKSFDDLVVIAKAVCGTSMAAVTLIDVERQWFKSIQGIDAAENLRSESMCGHAILQPQEIMVVEDALQDIRFHDNPVVAGDPHIRFYAGAPLISSDGLPLGTLCVFDAHPQHLASDKAEALSALSRQVMLVMELRRFALDIQKHMLERDDYERLLSEYQDLLLAQNADLTEQSRTDALTGLPNRRAMSAALEAAVVDADGVLIGLFTDGDLRRALDSALDVRTAKIADVMTRNPRTIGADQLAVEAARQMETQKINGLIVVDGQGRAVGALNIHDLLRARVV